MVYPVDLTAALTGASVGQLQHWRSTGLLRSEFRDGRTVLYSFRDVVALRTFVRLRATAPLQRIRRAVGSLKSLDLTEHPSTYQLRCEGSSIVLVENDAGIDLVDRPGQQVLTTLDDVFGPFETRQGRSVVDLRRPRPRLEVKETRLQGWPTIQGTRVTFDTVAKFVSGDDVAIDDVALYYPTVTPEAARDALDFYQEVGSMRRLSA